MYPKADLVTYFKHQIEELKYVSEMTISSLINQAELIELSAEKRHTIPDSLRIGLYFVLKGTVNWVFQV
jgi:hypothetical protein